MIKNALKIPLENSKRKFIMYSAGGYFYFSYLPQIPAVIIGKILNLNVLNILYLGRLLALLFYILCVWYAIKIVPTGKLLLTTLALMPMSLAQAASYNPDCVAFSLAFLGVSLVIKIIFSSEKFVFNPENILLLGIMLIIGILKPVFVPIALLLYLVPKERFKTRYHYFLINSVTFILSVVFAFIWYKIGSNTGGAIGNLDVDNAGINPAEKITELKSNPFVVFDVLQKTFSYFHTMYYHSTIGILGYLDTTLPSALYTTFTLLIIFLTFFDADKNYSFRIYQRLVLLTVSTSVALLTIFALYVLSTRTASGHVTEGVQGRYFIPILFPLFLTFAGFNPARLNLSNNKVFNGLLFIVLLVALIKTQSVLQIRYYG
jgi:uncharacterized membrane protein